MHGIYCITSHSIALLEMEKEEMKKEDDRERIRQKRKRRNDSTLANSSVHTSTHPSLSCTILAGRRPSLVSFFCRHGLRKPVVEYIRPDHPILLIKKHKNKTSQPATLQWKIEQWPWYVQDSLLPLVSLDNKTKTVCKKKKKHDKESVTFSRNGIVEWGVRGEGKKEKKKRM